MTERETTRLIAWNHELRRVHARLREALHVTREAVRDGDPTTSATRDLLLYCHGFCTALDAHHRGEDRSLFPAIEAVHPHLAPVLRNLEQDHSMLGHLLRDLDTAVERSVTPDELDAHLEGIAALMENHFRYEERQLLSVLEALDLDADIGGTLGPL
ncbi:MAG: hemerythrin domain-containing protein [Tessaracoccus sp.]